VSGWASLGEELDRWAEAGRTAAFWWRDDDAAEPSPALDRLLALAAAGGVPLSLAVIPMAATPELAARLAAEAPEARPAVLVHGFAHRNLAAPGEKKAEFPSRRPVGVMAGEAAAGLGRLREMFGAGTRPWLVPPWNRLPPSLVARLPGAGFRGLSTFGRRASREPVAGLVQVNTHLDPVDWRGTRGFAGEDRVLATLGAELAARRRGGADGAEPTGLLTHHLVLDAAGWGFVERLVDATRAHPAARWLSARELFDGAGEGP